MPDATPRLFSSAEVATLIRAALRATEITATSGLVAGWAIFRDAPDGLRPSGSTMHRALDDLVAFGVLGNAAGPNVQPAYCTYGANSVRNPHPVTDDAQA